MVSWKSGFLKAAATLVLLLGAGAARADYTASYITWPGWHISTSEEPAEGHPVVHSVKPPRIACNTDYGKPAGTWYTTRFTYPLTYLFDNNPKTAWVFNPNRHGDGAGKPNNYVWGGLRSVKITPDRPVTIDAVWIMAGYNKSARLYRANSRPSSVRISVNGHAVRTVGLYDVMGWHKIRLGRVSARSVTIGVTRVAKGNLSDVCISEIALARSGRRIDMHMPRAVGMLDGSECGCGTMPYAISSDGLALGCDNSNGEGCILNMNTRGYVCGVEYVGKIARAWVCNLATGKRHTLATKKTPKPWDDSQPDAPLTIRWAGDKVRVGVLNSKHNYSTHTYRLSAL